LKAIISKEKVIIEDLGITLYPGSVRWLEEEEYKSSICLKVLQKMGKVQVMDSKRHKKKKENKESSNRVNRAARKYRSPPHNKPKPPSSNSGPNMVTEEEARRLAELAAKKAADNAVAQLTAKFTEFMERSNPSPTPVETGGIEQAVQQAVSQALQSAKIPTNSQGVASELAPSSGPEEPIFIPAGIVKQDSEDLSVQITSSKDENIDDAVAALKALKKK